MGLGSLIGTILCGKLYDWMVVGGLGGWTCYWLALAVMCLASMIYFSVGYRGVGSGSVSASGP